LLFPGFFMTQPKHFYSLILGGILTISYAVTLAPGITWANSGADGGDLITAAATNGVAHPSGYPLYLLLARVFQWLPIGSLAFRTNLFSAICTICAALVLQVFLRRQQNSAGVALIAGLAFGLAPAVWSQAVITEVYGLQSLLIILFIFGLFDEKFPGGDWARGLLFGLATSNHLTTLCLLPLLLFRFGPAPGFVKPADLGKRSLACLLGLALYLTLPLRASFHPPVNWGNPITLPSFWWLVSGQLYATYPFGISLTDAVLRLRAFAGLLLEQFTLLGVSIGVYGLFSGLSRRILLTSLWVFVAFSGFAIFYGSYDSQVYLIPAYIVFTLWLAYGIQDVLRVLSVRSPQLAQFVVILMIAGLLVRLPFTIPKIDAAHDQRAEQFGAKFIASAPHAALIFASGDEAVFALWYFHYALGQRPDVAVIADDLLPYVWYASTIAETYPSLRISPTTGVSRFEIIANNPDRPICYVLNITVTDAQFCSASP
jgi:hypothetical protein